MLCLLASIIPDKKSDVNLILILVYITYFTLYAMKNGLKLDKL